MEGFPLPLFINSDHFRHKIVKLKRDYYLLQSSLKVLMLFASLKHFSSNKKHSVYHESTEFVIEYNISLMGNSEPAHKSQANPPLVEHPRFSRARITPDKKMILEQKQHAGCIDMVNKIAALNPQNKKPPLLLPKIEETHSENFCGVEKSVNLIFGHYRFTLFEEIGRRKAMKLNFEETQLWFLLYHLLQASATFQRKKQKSGDIRPRNVLIDDKGEVAVLNTLSFPDELTNYYKSLYNAEKTYLAPEELAELEMKVKYCKSDPVIAESFSIGLTIVDAALLTDSEELFDFQEVSFKNYQFQDNLVAFKSMNLTPFFIKTVLNLLEVQHFNRPTPGEVLAILTPYQKEILDLTQFVADREKSRQSLQSFQSRC